jgi:hypothetical protein
MMSIKTKEVTVKVEIAYDRLRIRINGTVHVSIPFRENDSNSLIVHSYFIGKEKFFNIDYHIGDQVIETGYTRKDIFEAILKGLEEKNVI